MSVHTYIGARYVPRFMGVYDATQIYEALDVVDNGSGTSYIARDIVPAGTPLTDTDHWAVYGAASGAIIQLQNDMIQAQSDIGDLQNDITALQAQLVGADIRVAAFTDSYGTTAADGTPFIDQLGSRLGLTNADYFGFARGSVGITPNSSQPRGVQGLVEDSIASVTDPDTITHVLFALGANDIDNLSTIVASFSSLVTYTRSQFPNAIIMFAFIGTTDAHSVSDKNAAVEAYKVNATLNKCVYIENADLIMRVNQYQKADKVHPSSDGSDALANALAFGILNGRVTLNLSGLFSFAIGGISFGVNYQITDNIIKMSAPASGAFGSPVSITGSYVAYTPTNIPVDGVGAGEGIALFTASGEIGAVVGNILLNNGNVYLKTTGGAFTALNIAIPEFIMSLRDVN